MESGIKVCKECWMDIDLEDAKRCTFKLSDFVKIGHGQRDCEESDWLCSDFCEEQWRLTWLQSCLQERDDEESKKMLSKIKYLF